MVDRLYLRDILPVPHASNSLAFDWQSNQCESRPQGTGSFRECAIIRDRKESWFRLHFQNLTGIEADNLHLGNFLFSSLQVSFSRWLNTTFTKGEIWEVNFSQAIFRNVTFDGTDLRGSSFVGTQFEDCAFLNVTMQDINFREARFTRTRFENAKCHQCDFGGANFIDSTPAGDFEGSYYNVETRFPFSWLDASNMGFVYKK